MDKCEEMVKDMISTALHVKYADGFANSKDDILREAVDLKNALEPLYPVTDKQWANILADIGSYAECLVSENPKSEHYFIGKHDLGTFPDILLVIECRGDNYEIPFTPRTYQEISRAQFLELADGQMEIRKLSQPYRSQDIPLQ